MNQKSKIIKNWLKQNPGIAETDSKPGRKLSPEAKKHLQDLKAKIPREVVEAIRQCSAAGMRRKDLVSKFKQAPSTISNITNNRTYTYS